MPARPSRASASWMLIVGVAIGALLAPVGAVAAGQLVEVSSASGRKADVTRAEQLQTAEASPHQFVRHVTGFGGAGCFNGYTAPATKAIIVKTLHLDAFVTDGNDDVRVWTRDGNCASSTAVVLVDIITVTGVTQVARSYEPGLVIPAGHMMTFSSTSGLTAYAWVNGYKVPSTAVTGATVTGDTTTLPARPER